MLEDDIFKSVREGVQSVTDKLFHALRRAIVSGTLPPGKRLIEREISSQAGVSRSPVREAFRRLEAEGLVRHIPRRGVEVVGIERENVEDVFAIRKALLGLIAERAAVHATPEQLETIRCAVEDAEHLVRHREGFLMTQDEFNTALMDAGRMPLASDFVRQLADYLHEFRLRSLYNQERRVAAAAEHRAIYEALARREPEAARKASDEHANKSAERVKAVVLKSEQAPDARNVDGEDRQDQYIRLQQVDED